MWPLWRHLHCRPFCAFTLFSALPRSEFSWFSLRSTLCLEPVSVPHFSFFCANNLDWPPGRALLIELLMHSQSNDCLIPFHLSSIAPSALKRPRNCFYQIEILIEYKFDLVLKPESAFGYQQLWLPIAAIVVYIPA